MKIMFIGLGLIGGSMAMALEGYPDLERYAVDGDEPTRLEALGRNVVRAAWPNADDAPIEDMDIVVICLHPEAAADFVRRQAGRIKPGALLTDVCGVKRPLFEAVGEVQNRQFIYLGGHPMAGRERGGFAHATADLFRGAHYILTPDAGVPQESIHMLEQLVTFMGTRPEALVRAVLGEQGDAGGTDGRAGGAAFGIQRAFARRRPRGAAGAADGFQRPQEEVRHAARFGREPEAAV